MPKDEVIAHFGVQGLVFMAAWMIPSFIAWDFNPATWEPVNRGFIAFMWLCAALGASALVHGTARP